ncbi:MAG: cqsS [Gammaproteobacteria bacterium]|jgi:PAS domain S-box-containing protein|nr:cqsS [Gammaproteobacteria bacterium]
MSQRLDSPDELPVYIYWLDHSNRFLGCNRQFAEIVGIKLPHEIAGKQYNQLPYYTYNPQLLDTWQKNNQLALSNKEAALFEEHYPLLNKQVIPHYVYKIPLFDPQRHLTALVNIAFNTNRLKEPDKEDLQNTLTRIIDLIPANIYWQDKQGLILGCNQSQAQSLGYRNTEEVVGKHLNELVPAAEAKSLLGILHDVVNNERALKIEEQLTFNEKAVTLISEKVPFRNQEGNVIGLLGVSIDVSEQKLVESELLETRHKLAGMTLVAASIAHELRTPLTSLDLGVGSLRDFIPILLEGYEVAVKAKLIEPKLKSSTIAKLKGILDSMGREIALSALAINLLLENLKPEANTTLTERFSMVHCVNDALSRYPFKHGQRELIEWQPTSDFKVLGAETLVTHILFNFLKNSLHYIAEARKGQISIWLEVGNAYNTLYFKDTSKGIPDDILSNLFTPFFSKTHHGTGIGLSYCKAAMEKLGGQVTCHSVYGDYTLFKLVFPDCRE